MLTWASLPSLNSRFEFSLFGHIQLSTSFDGPSKIKFSLICHVIFFAVFKICEIWVFLYLVTISLVSTSFDGPSKKISLIGHVIFFTVFKIWDLSISLFGHIQLSTSLDGPSKIEFSLIGHVIFFTVFKISDLNISLSGHISAWYFFRRSFKNKIFADWSRDLLYRL